MRFLSGSPPNDSSAKHRVTKSNLLIFRAQWLCDHIYTNDRTLCSDGCVFVLCPLSNRHTTRSFFVHPDQLGAFIHSFIRYLFIMSLFTTMVFLPLVMSLTHAHAILPRNFSSHPVECTIHRSRTATTIYTTASTSTWTPPYTSGWPPITTSSSTCSEVTTVYETVYSTFCPTCHDGLGPATYTLTQVCPDTPGSPCRPTGDNCPPGFTKTVSVCDDCAHDPVTATLTLPCPETTTVYTTAYESFCSTGLEHKTYTVTQVCREETCERPPVGKPPPGFTEVVDVCTTCGTSPITATLTLPAGEPSGNGQVVATKPLGPAEVPAQPTETGTPAEIPGEGNPSEGNPGESNPGQGNPGENNPGESNPGQGNPGQGNPGQGNPGESNPTGVYVAGAVSSPAIGVPILFLAFCIPGILFRIAF